jgi:hypothetical protein
MRLDVYKAKVAAQKNLNDSGEWDKLSPEQQRLVDKMVSPGRRWTRCAEAFYMIYQILDGTRAGLALLETQRNELMSLKKELSHVCLEFSVRTF